MTYMDKAFATHIVPPELTGREPSVVLIEDGGRLSHVFRSICDCLDVEVVRMASWDDLDTVLRHHRPMAVVAELDADGQDGCHVLMTVASYDRTLPVLLITGCDPALIGAVDAVEEIWNLTSVTRWSEPLGAREVVDFLFRTGLAGHCMRLMPV